MPRLLLWADGEEPANPTTSASSLGRTKLATPLGLRPLGTLRPLEDILVLLTGAGFSGPKALHI
jgi:hypothetical protein